MKQFEVNVKDEVGSLETIAEALAKRNINIISISSERHTDKSALLKIITNDEEQTRDIMDMERFIYKETDFLVVTLKDEPGQLLRVTRMLKNADINIESLHILNKKNGETEIALIVDKMEEAEAALKNFSYQV